MHYLSKKAKKTIDKHQNLYYNIIVLGEWLNGRVVVSKTIGCVFESRLPCQYSNDQTAKIGGFLI